MFLTTGIERLLFTQLNVLIPFDKAHAAKGIFNCHIKGIIIQPITVFTHKFLKFFILLYIAVLKSGTQYLKAGQINLLIIDIFFIVTEIILVTVLLCQKSFFDQRLQIDVIRISRKSRKRLIRRIAVSGWTKRQNLPVACASISTNSYACLEKVPIPYSDGMLETGKSTPLFLIISPMPLCPSPRAKIYEYFYLFYYVPGKVSSRKTLENATCKNKVCENTDGLFSFTGALLLSARCFRL